MKFNETEHYYQGYSSHQTGVLYESSPHVIGTPARLEWCRGWRDAEYDSRRRLQKYEAENANQQLESLASKPVEVWSGVGLPPVGTECEWLASGDHDWIGVKVLAYHEDEAWLQPLNGAQSFTVGNPDDFRPMRSDADRKREEIANALDKELGNIEKYPTWKDALIGVYDLVAAGKVPHIKPEPDHE